MPPTLITLGLIRIDAPARWTPGIRAIEEVTRKNTLMGLQNISRLAEKRHSDDPSTQWDYDPYIPQRDTHEYWMGVWEAARMHSVTLDVPIEVIARRTQVSPAFVRVKLMEHGIYETDMEELDDELQKKHMKKLMDESSSGPDTAPGASGVLEEKLS